MDDLGFWFWAKLAGLFLFGAIASFVVFILFVSAVYAWGLLGTFLFVAAGSLLAGWLFDRREAQRHRSSYQ